MNKNIILIIAGSVILVGGLVWFLSSPASNPASEEQNDVIALGVPNVEPIDLVLDFYDAWHAAVRSTSTDPYMLFLYDSVELSVSLQNSLKDGRGVDTEIDPVLCQLETPEKIRARILFADEGKAQIMVIAGGKKLPGTSVAHLEKGELGWYINDITCSMGETAEVGEFAFENEGSLLKSVPPPYNPELWHLVFEQDGVEGYVVPLEFTGESMCTDRDGKESVCVPDRLVQTDRAYVQADMTESGAIVRKLEILQR